MIFSVYTDPQSYDVFLEWLNGLHPTIKFMATGDKQKVNYLDTLAKDNTLAVGPYRKPTDKNTL